MATASPARAHMSAAALSGRTAVILGADGALGVAAATALADLGARVVVAGRCGDRLEEHYGGDERFEIRPFAPAPADDIGTLASAFDDTEVLVHCEGTISSCFDAIRRFTPAMAARRRGSIITISSPRPTCAGRGDDSPPPSREPLHQMVLSLATEMRPFGVRVNALAPKGVESSSAVAFLASDASVHVTGAVLAMEHGWSLLERLDSAELAAAAAPASVQNLYRDGAHHAVRPPLSFPVRLHENESATKGRVHERRRA